MTERVSSSPAARGSSTSPPPSGRGGKRPRTAYRLYRRYRALSRLAAVSGAGVGVVLVAFNLGPALAAGEWVPASSYVVAFAIVAALAIIPYGFLRWRWRRLKAQLNDD